MICATCEAITLSVVVKFRVDLESRTFEGKTSDRELINSRDNCKQGHSPVRSDRGMEVHVGASRWLIRNGDAVLEAVASLPDRRASSGSPYLHTARRLYQSQPG